MPRTILHSDLNAFYASAEELYHPELREKPIVVGGDVGARHGIVLTKNQLAKKAGVKTGEALLCTASHKSAYVMQVFM